MIEFLGSPDEFLGMLDRVRERVEQEEAEFWGDYPDGLEIEFTDGETVTVKGPANAERSGNQPRTP